MTFFQRRRLGKLKKHLLHEARHAVNMREDVAAPQDLQALAEAEKGLEDAWGRGEAAEIESAMECLSHYIGCVYPARPLARWREYVEIIAVALAVAMGFRTYFLQPFKIPTGSMQPTLYGITVEPRDAPALSDRFPLNILKLALGGRRYIEVRAADSGRVDSYYQFSREDDAFVIYINKTPHLIYRNMKRFFDLDQQVAKGQILAAGERVYGDHIFVDKVRYNFTRPNLGDIIVFDTSHIEHPQIRQDTFYIKRLAGLPGDTVSIQPPHLVVNGQPVTGPYPFERMLTGRDEGYNGYVLPRSDQAGDDALLKSPQDVLTLGPDEYLPLGDNSAHSLDGRYFGPVQSRDLVGPAVGVYWPFSRRWGRVR